MLFDDRFEVVLADTASSKAINYKLRYRVFCLEKGYEDPNTFRDQMERDEYDRNAVHFLVRDKEQERWVAAARLVIGTADSLPVTDVARIELPDLPSTQVIAEFSRLLIVDGYRNPQQEGMHEPEIVLGLFRAAREYSRQVGIKHWVFFCRRGLWRMLANIGLGMEAVGPACTFRGLRIPYRMDMQTVCNEVPKFSLSTHKMLSRPWKSFIHYSSYCTRSKSKETSNRFWSTANSVRYGSGNRWEKEATSSARFRAMG